MIDAATLFRMMQGGFQAAHPQQSFGLPPGQDSLALQAMMPAFMMGLARRSAEPGGLDLLMDMARGWGVLVEAGRPGGAADMKKGGSQAMTELFGSSTIAQQVADQAARATGLQMEAMREAMPVVAFLFVSSLMRMQEQAAAGWMASAGASPVPPKGPAPTVPAPKAAPAPAPKAALPPGAEPSNAPAVLWAQMMDDWMARWQPAGAAAPEPEPEPEPPPPDPSPHPASVMMDMSLAARDAYVRNLAAIFDGLGAGARKDK